MSHLSPPPPVAWFPFCGNTSCPCMEPSISGPCAEHKETPTNPRCAECGWPQHHHPATKGPTMTGKNDDDSGKHYVLESEDWFCGLGLLLGFCVQVVAAWANPGVADQLATGGQSATFTFFIAWVICKIVRGRKNF
jgi:hypothetical protein